MARDKHTPIYNMKAVSQETGINPDTLRAWERRYGIPNPQRTGGGHRLFSQYEMDMLKWINERQDEGLSISHSVTLWQQITEKGDDPLEVMPLKLIEDETPIFDMSVVGNQVKDLRDAWIKACKTFDEQQAQHILAQAFAMYPLETVCFDILQKGLRIFGDEWYKGNVTVQQEHFASSIAMRQLQALLSSLSSLPRNGRILIACAPEEQHTFSGLLLSLMLRRRQFDVINLGANVPIGRMQEAIEAIRPELIILTSQTLYTASTLLEMAEHLHSSSSMVAYGGAVFSKLKRTRERMPAYFLGAQLERAADQVEELMERKPSSPPLKPLSEPYQQAVTHFANQRSKIDAFIHNQAVEYEVPSHQINNANNEFGRNITAALQLGDMDIIYANLEWLEGLLANHHYRLPRKVLEIYFSTYYEGCRRYLDPTIGAPILTWLSELQHQIQQSKNGVAFS